MECMEHVTYPNVASSARSVARIGVSPAVRPTLHIHRVSAAPGLTRLNAPPHDLEGAAVPFHWQVDHSTVLKHRDTLKRSRASDQWGITKSRKL